MRAMRHVLLGRVVAIDNLAHVLADDPILTAKIDKRMAAKLLERAAQS
jgi:hypothetical protein